MKEDSDRLVKLGKRKKFQQTLANTLANGVVIFALVSLHFGWFAGSTSILTFAVGVYTVIATVLLILTLVLFFVSWIMQFYAKRLTDAYSKDEEIHEITEDKDIIGIKEQIEEVSKIDQLTPDFKKRLLIDIPSIVIVYFAFVNGFGFLFAVELLILLTSRMIGSMVKDTIDELKKFTNEKAKHDLRTKSQE